MLCKQVQYQGKVGCIRVNFQNIVSLNTGESKLGGFFLRHSHIYIPIPVAV